MRSCRRCGEPIPEHKYASAVFCSVLCRERERKGRKTRKPGEPRPPVPKTCACCGKDFLSRYGAKYCGFPCQNKAVKERSRRRKSLPPDRQEKTCDVCGGKFTSRRAMQRYCGKQCAQFARNKSQIDKSRKTEAEPRTSPEMIEARAAALRATWDEETRFRRRASVPFAPGDDEDDE